ncbi:MAG TPA: quinone oxidoreductase [Nitrospirota bacterium]|nr:quinone oxidoreductase [Nitrospirota bacterium]
MRAIKVTRYGNADVLSLTETEPKPKPSAGQALVRIYAAGVNFVDIYQRRGTYPVKLPYIPGLEAAGVVEAVGEAVTEIQPGDRIAYTGHLGSYSEYTAIDASRLILLSERLSFEEGAAVPLQGMTAHYLIHDFHQPKPGDIVLIHAAAGGVGLLLVQWAKHLGATVIGTVSSEDKADVVKKAGADHAIIYTKQNFVNAVKLITGGQGVQLILDGVGKSTFTGNLEAAAVHSHVVIFGASSGPADSIVPNSLMARSITVSGGSLPNFISTRSDLQRRFMAVQRALQEGWLKLRFDHVLPLAEAEKSHRLLEGRRSMGKIVLKVVGS